MNRTLTLLLALAPLSLFAASGGPDTYGYIWKDSSEPGGPVFNWIDITGIGIQVQGLADDNVVGPFVMQTNMPYYWYSRKNLWIGSNGYLAFSSVNIASPFPTIPQAGGANDYIAALTSDLNFSGAGNPGQCWVYDTQDTTIVSYINVPFWTNLPPSWTGSNTFQIILSKPDSTIVIQFLQQSGLTQNNDIVIGIESVSGDIGLQHSADIYPPSNYAIRFEAPAVPLIQITDAAVEWLTESGSRGHTLQRNGSPWPLTMKVLNTGNVDLGSFTASGSILNTLNQPVLAAQSVTIMSLGAGVDTLITFADPYLAPTAGTFKFRGSISGIPGELVTSNNALEQELQVYDTTSNILNVRWSGASDNGIGIGWSGGNGGVGTHLDRAPFYPCQVTHFTIRITSNANTVGYYLKVYDDDGPNGTPGTLLDSVFVPPAAAGAGDQAFPLASPFLWTEGGLYVQWYMGGEFVNIAVDATGPFSLRSYEVLDNVWAEYRDRENADFHLGLRVSQLPVFDVGCSGFFGLANGLQITQPLIVRTWLRNYGNQAATNVPVNYRFNSEPAVAETYTGPSIQPGDSVLYTFNQQFIPGNTASGQFCAWSAWANDQTTQNDTVCVSVDVIASIEGIDGVRLSLFPNPATDRTVIIGPLGGRGELLLVDLGGAVVRRWPVMGGDRMDVDVKDIAPGTYLYQLRTQDVLWTGKLVLHRP